MPDGRPLHEFEKKIPWNGDTTSRDTYDRTAEKSRARLQGIVDVIQSGSQDKAA